MEKLSMCRLCMVVDVRFYNIINTPLQELYEIIIGLPLETKDQRSHDVCYICYARLRNCHKLRATGLRSDRLFSEILDNKLNPALCNNNIALKVTHPLILLSNVPENSLVEDCYVKIESVDILDGATVNEEINDNELQGNDLDTVDKLWKNSIIDYGVHEISEKHFVSETLNANHTKIEQKHNTKDIENIDKSKNIRSKLYQNESQDPTSDNHNLGTKIENFVTVDNPELTKDIKLEKYVDLGVELPENYEIGNSDSEYPTSGIHNLGTEIENVVPKDTDLIKDIKLENNVDLGVEIPENYEIGNSDSEYPTSEYNVCPKIVKIILHRIDDTKLYNPSFDARIKKEPEYGHKYDLKRLQEKITVSQLNTSEKGNLMKEESNRISTHTGDSQYKCTNNQIYKCNVCEERFYDNNTFSKHFRHNKCGKFYKSDVCETRFCDKSYALKNNSRVFNKRNVRCETDNNSKDSKIDKKLFKCDVCEKAYTLKCNLIRHYNAHTGKSYECDICKKTTVRKCYLKQHMKTHSKVSLIKLDQNKPHACDICNKRFYNKYNLNMHTLIHTGERPYKCDICDKTFNHKGHLNVHIRIHTGEKPFKCDFCGKTYSNQSHLINHVRKHTGEKPYECDMCTKRYSKKSHLNNHVLIHAAVKPYKCDVCKKLYSTKESIRVHMRSQHS